MINNWRLECFVCVSQTLNFRQAAEALHVSQPALTRQINSLEADLGVRLFDRDTTHVSLTNEGSAFLGPAITTLQEMRELEGMFRRNPSVVFNFLYQYGLYEVGTRFRARRPNTALNMLRLKIWGDTPSVIKQPGNVVIGREDVIRMQAGGVFVPLTDARYYLIVPKDDPLAQLDVVSVGDIDPERVIIRSGSRLSTRDIDDPGIRLEDLLGDRHFIGCNSLNETIEVIRCGCGVAFTLMPLDMDPGLLARVVLDTFEPVKIGIGYLRQHETEDVRALVDVLTQVYRDGDGVPVEQGGIPAGGVPAVLA
ncbi:MAG: LysR family transcriptional regulator [Coriobacteriales bacterium]|jgi:DNA-binding transcriptional LysR family regulator